jgi:hypothetical protein
VEDGEEDLNPPNTSSVLCMVPSAITNEFEQECRDEAVRLLNAYPICQSTDNWIPGHKHSIPGLPGTKFLVHQVGAICLIIRRWVWEADMSEALVADEMGLATTFTSVAVAMLSKLGTGPVVMRLPLSIVWGNILEEWVVWCTTTFLALSVKNW